jgi:hypothetical protein
LGSRAISEAAATDRACGWASTPRKAWAETRIRPGMELSSKGRGMITSGSRRARNSVPTSPYQAFAPSDARRGGSWRSDQARLDEPAEP